MIKISLSAEQERETKLDRIGDALSHDTTSGRIWGAKTSNLGVLLLWRRSLERRSQKAGVTWAKMERLAAEWLPPPHVQHPWPEDRLAVRTQGRSRMP